MSGHSHFHSIKHKKEAEDKKRGKIFSKLSRLISVAAREGGGDITGNPRLKLAIEQAKSFNMPKDNIERAIKKGTGELESERLEEVEFEVFGPGGIALIVEGITDNKNRTLNEVKQILNQNNSKMANEGSVKWLFERKGIIELNPFEKDEEDNKNDDNNNNEEEKEKIKEEIELAVIDSGAENMSWQEDILEVYASPSELENVKKNIEKKGIKIESSSLGWLAKEEIEVDEKKKEAIERLIELLEDNDAIQNIYSNMKE